MTAVGESFARSRAALRVVSSFEVRKQFDRSRLTGLAVRLVLACGHEERRRLSQSERDAWARGAYRPPGKVICSVCRSGGSS